MRVPTLLLGFLVLAKAFAAESWVSTASSNDAFPLAPRSAAAPIYHSADDFRVVAIAAQDLAADIERVTGRRPTVRVDAPSAGPAVLIGTLGKSALIDGLVASGKLDTAALRGSWETFLITTVADPLPGVAKALVIAGSDRRGTAFGVYELSQAIGVSPWYWWADVTPDRKEELHIAAGTRKFGPPSVKYRGIFLNDEDWGLQPWAAKTFEPEAGDIGPKTYAKIFELMLRLKANTVWPAMHECTKAFNDFPQNKLVAGDYAMVMGSSHAEPMLRNNVGEWKEAHNLYNYVSNREGVRAYWEKRVRENGKFENIYTIGMRGIHDSAIQGTKTDEERINVLHQVFADQREMLAKHVSPQVEQIPQMFCAYKEVLNLYRKGLQVPDDVTIVWPDDNHGYIRNYANAEERKRSGGFGVYYHISYLGAPMSYLWLYTTPPALVWEEMSKAYDHGAQRMWILNVGDLKPGEIGTELFLQMGWDIRRWQRESISQYLPTWAAREFGPAHAAEIAAIMSEYYQLNYQRKPEHLQWSLPNKPLHPSDLTVAEIQERRSRFAALRARADKLLPSIAPEKRDALFELVVYPVRGSALANERFLGGELAAFTPPGPEREKLAMGALAADAEIAAQTRIFNEQIAGGKWRGFMSVEMGEGQWRSYRPYKWELPKYPGEVPPKRAGIKPGTAISIEAEKFAESRAGSGARWEVVPGLGRTGDSVTIYPTTMAPVDSAKLATEAPRMDYTIEVPSAGTFNTKFYLVPTQPIEAGRGLRFAIAIDDEAPREVNVNVRDGSAEWAQSVLNATVNGVVPITIATPGKHTLRVYGVDAGVVLDKIVIDLGGLVPSYLGP